MTAVPHTDPLAMLVIGTNHRQASLDFRERIAFVPDEVPAFLLRARTALDNSDVFMLSTCNRTELYALHPSLEGVAARVRDLLVEYKAIDAARDAQKFYEYHGRNAVEQLFRVAAGIDSQALGEIQILQQVKDAYDVSLQANVLGVVGERLLAAAIRCGKRARAETSISAGAIASASPPSAWRTRCSVISRRAPPWCSVRARRARWSRGICANTALAGC
jgi:glutamyl-tRNA reductase